MLGVVTASIASWLVGQVRDGEPDERAAAQELSWLRAEVRELTETLRRQPGATTAAPDGGPAHDQP